MQGNSERVPAARSIPELLESLCSRGLLPAADLSHARELSRRRRIPLDAALQETGVLPGPRLAQWLAEACGLPLYEPHADAPDYKAMRRISRHEATRSGALPIQDDGAKVVVAAVDPFDPLLDDRWSALFPGRRRETWVIARADLHDLLNAAWQVHDPLEPLMQLLEPAAGGASTAVSTGGAQITRFCDAILEDGVARGASDIHLDPGDHLFRVRMRVDGLIVDVLRAGMGHWQALVHRFKILAEMDIGRHMDAQNGQFSLSMQGRRVSFRAAVLPTLHGESLVLRVLDQRRSGARLGELGLSATAAAQLARAMRRPDGLFLITGPIAGGKTTTAAAMLGAWSTGRCVVTLEDPVEVLVPGARQVPLNAWGFTGLMREVLRQDADVVFLGEIRDADSAALTVSTAMIGRQVLATLHARDAVAAISRMLSLDVDGVALAESLAAVTNQRLLPRKCPHCAGIPFSAAAGRTACAVCRGTGVLGRVPVMEVLVVTDAMRDTIAQRDVRALRLLAHQALAGADLRAETLHRIDASEVSREAAEMIVDLSELPP